MERIHKWQRWNNKSNFVRLQRSIRSDRPPPILVQKLKTYDLPSWTIDWITDFRKQRVKLNHCRKQRVKLNQDCYSEWELVTAVMTAVKTCRSVFEMHNTRNSKKLHKAFQRTNYRKHTVFSKGIDIWNNYNWILKVLLAIILSRKKPKPKI